jgi:hypothetical protein
MVQVEVEVALARAGILPSSRQIEGASRTSRKTSSDGGF